MKGRRRKRWIWEALAGMDCGYENKEDGLISSGELAHGKE
jgi:hypothetical protein